MKYYIVFERVCGSKTWTIAHKDPQTIQGIDIGPVPAVFINRSDADAFCDNVMSTRRGYWGGIPNQRAMDTHVAEVEVPE